MHHACFANVKNSKFPIHHPIDYEQFLASEQRNKVDGEAAGQTSCATRTGAAVRCGGAVRRCRGFTAEPVQPDLSDRHGISPCNGYHGLPEPIPHQNWFSTCGDDSSVGGVRGVGTTGTAVHAQLEASLRNGRLIHYGIKAQQQLTFGLGSASASASYRTRLDQSGTVRGARRKEPPSSDPRPATLVQPPDTRHQRPPESRSGTLWTERSRRALRRVTRSTARLVPAATWSRTLRA